MYPSPQVERAMLDTLRFWLDRGVAGFRLDAITTLFEDTQLRNEPQKPGVNAQGDPIVSRVYTDNLPEVRFLDRSTVALGAPCQDLVNVAAIVQEYIPGKFAERPHFR
jgi:alpha-glucosidase